MSVVSEWLLQIFFNATPSFVNIILMLIVQNVCTINSTANKENKNTNLISSTSLPCIKLTMNYLARTYTIIYLF